jgi:hypothetical protein
MTVVAVVVAAGKAAAIAVGNAGNAGHARVKMV